MAEEMRKRLEEAADAICNCQGCPSIFMYGGCKKECVMHELFKKGFELGYKEAIKMAKEWLEENTYNKIIKGDLPDDREEPDCCTLYSTQQQLLADFESDINKLWEDTK